MGVQLEQIKKMIIEKFKDFVEKNAINILLSELINLKKLQEQKIIAERVDKIMKICDRLEEVVKSQEEMKGLMRNLMQLGRGK